MILLYAAINLFIDDHWSLGSFCFSLAVNINTYSCVAIIIICMCAIMHFCKFICQVSIKMNVLLYAPALLLVYLTVLGLPHTFVQLSICAGVQVP